MALSSSSTYTQALAQYNDTLSWEGSPANARLHLEAIRWIRVNRPSMQSAGEIRFQLESLAAEEELVQSYVAALSAASSATRTYWTQGRPVL